MVPTVVLYQLQQSVVSLYCNIGLLSIYPYYSLEMQLIVVFLPVLPFGRSGPSGSKYIEVENPSGHAALPTYLHTTQGGKPTHFATSGG
jgi:hypothetical protein